MSATATKIAAGQGWEASDVVCSASPGDPAIAEEHRAICVALVTEGMFGYRTRQGDADAHFQVKFRWPLPRDAQKKVPPARCQRNSFFIESPAVWRRRVFRSPMREAHQHWNNSAQVLCLLTMKGQLRLSEANVRKTHDPA